MKAKQCMALVAYLLYCSCSYSEIINGTTTNAAGNGLTWRMPSVLPASTGLTVDGVIYQYTAVKNAKDPMVVNVQNLNAINTGYIFRSQDDWTGRPGNSITKVVPVDNIPAKYWGDGSITVDGQGQVTNPNVVYKYRYDTCYNPLSDPSCPGYAQAMLDSLTLKEAQPVDPLSNEYVRNSLQSKSLPEEEKKAELNAKKDSKVEKDLKDKKIIPNTMLSAEDTERVSRLELMNNIPGFDAYSINIVGGVYNDVIRYPEKRLPDSRRGRSIGLAQEKLHGAMVDSQYEKR